MLIPVQEGVHLGRSQGKGRHGHPVMNGLLLVGDFSSDEERVETVAEHLRVDFVIPAVTLHQGLSHEVRYRTTTGLQGRAVSNKRRREVGNSQIAANWPRWPVPSGARS